MAEAFLHCFIMFATMTYIIYHSERQDWSNEGQLAWLHQDCECSPSS